ncbi:molybdopterin oxidoreductase family protein [Actinoallomurus soli]|uniref:molybdopterin oxidoreductase family protein n=1 Tax=Actinoallomurus soli TaxID=2952535 RepID=UPI002092EDDE|nr:nitrate reductase [Actinoallomurus soli]MCO5970798.1 nitrate reductase [Actinoallomurus soli]
MTRPRSDDDRIADIWGPRTPYAAGERWPVRVDRFVPGLADEDVDRWVPSACVLCSNCCGMDIAVKDGRIAGVRGRAVDRINHGRLGPKGLYGWQANNSPDRLTRPLVRRRGRLVETDWDTAMNLVAERSRRALDRHGRLGLGFYNTGQLFLEEYYTLAVIARAGLGTPHLDGNTRLCTATAEWALVETFGSDGNPGSYTDIDTCDTLLLVGHNVAETQTVLWMRMLDRLRGPDRPRLVVIDPRLTPVAREADVHLAIRPGTNVMILNAILHELIARDRVDHEWVARHTVGFDALADVVRDHPPERAAEVCGVEAADIREAARIIGAGRRLVSTALQGVYQSHQATAAAVQINNINLIRGMIGRPGCTVFQMNGQPTAQNTRETGANGSLTAFLNFQNDEHVESLARHWNVRPIDIPHWWEPTHAMEIFRFCEQGSIRFLWVLCTNPAVSLPELHRIRSILDQKRLFLVVQDAFLTETAELADVVLPAAMWGEKTGTYTNADRTVHLSDKAVEPPGEARADLDILLDYARRMDLRDKDGAPLVKWSTPEEAFGHFAAVSRDRPCDYSGLSYAKLRDRDGISWPCNERFPDGRERLYTDGVFGTGADYCESFGHDLETGAANEPDEYRAHDPAGRAIIKAAHYKPPHEPVDEDYPLQLSTGRTVYHWHTRTKTGRAGQLQDAAPRVWVELNPDDARSLGVAEGDLVRVESRRGIVHGPARLTGIRPGAVFVPFHYGYWDRREAGPRTAANEVTRTEWDPVSKQPIFKVTAVRVVRVAGRRAPAPAPEAGRVPAAGAHTVEGRTP